MLTWKKIVCPVDLSEVSMGALKLATRIGVPVRAPPS